MKDFTDSLSPATPSGPDIIAYERSRSAINVAQLSQHLLHRDDFLSRQSKVLAVLQKHAIFNKTNQLNLSRPDRFHLALARAKLLRRLSLEHKWDLSDYKMADYLIDEMSPYYLQSSMFVTTVREQGNDAQKAHWIPLIENWDILGCYGQTEMGHGSNVRGIETEARWDNKRKEFVLHSPTLTSSKWWNGALGRTANHAIVVAKLMLPDPDSKDGGYKAYGPHQFIMQIRDMETHEPLPGIVIGDIGPKHGYPSMDNGYMLFDHVRVPHDALLSKYSGVDSETGTYVKPDNPATVYGSLTYVRAQYIEKARLALARAVTVAVRYTAIRKQFVDRDAPGATEEEAVLNYPTVQIRLLPLLATTFALHYTGEALLKLYWSTRASIEESGDFSRLAELHAQSSALKSVCTGLAADGIETCRRAMGGHGFGGGSGMIALNGDYLSKPTVEGDNWMITQQTAAYLIKRMGQTVTNPTLQPTDHVDVQYWHYVRDRRAPTFDLESDADLLAAFRHRASHLAHAAYTRRVTQRQPWTSLMVPLHRLALAHAHMLLVANFHAALYAATPSPPLDETTQQILRSCFQLFALTTLQDSAAEFLLARAVTTQQLAGLDARIHSLMARLRPHAVRLVDAWAVPDYLLQSALGRHDGDVYRDLFRRAHRENPLNNVTFNPDWRSAEIVMGEGEAEATRRIEAMALGVVGPEHKGDKAKL